MDDSWQNSKSQTSSNFWCLDISQVAWTNILCVSTLPAHWSWKQLLGFPVFDHHQALRLSSPILQHKKSSPVIVWFMRRASAKAWEQIGVSIAFLIHFLGPKEGFEAIPYLQTIKCNSCSSISNNNLKFRGPRVCTKDCIKTLLLNTRKIGSTFTEIRREWTSHNNWSFVTRCWLKNVHKSWTLSLQEIGMAKTC